MTRISETPLDVLINTFASGEFKKDMALQGFQDPRLESLVFSMRGVTSYTHLDFEMNFNSMGNPPKRIELDVCSLILERIKSHFKVDFNIKDWEGYISEGWCTAAQNPYVGKLYISAYIDQLVWFDIDLLRYT